MPDYEFIDSLAEEQIIELHALFQREWWTQKRTLDEVRRMLEFTDLVFGFCEPSAGRLLAFARVLSDRQYKAFIFDVIVTESQRSRGLGKELMDRVLGHPDLARVRHFELYCLPDLVPFYEQWGFAEDLGDLRVLRLEREASGPVPDPEPDPDSRA